MTYFSEKLTLPDEIPLFPLEGALLLPNSRLPLNIFEPKFLKMLEDSLASKHRLIGMIQPKYSKNDEVKDKTSLSQVGCAGRVVSFTETEDSRYLITLSGISRFHVIETLEAFDPYITAKVDWTAFKEDGRVEKLEGHFKRDHFLKTLSEYFTFANLQTDWDSLKKAEDELLVNSLAILCPFDSNEKQALLEAKDIKERAEILLTLMEMSIRSEKNFGPLQ